MSGTLSTLCTLAGTCIRLASPYTDVAITAGTKLLEVNAKRVGYNQLLKETAYVQNAVRVMKSQLNEMEKAQKSAGFWLCSIDNARAIANETEDLLKWYEPTLVSKAQQFSDPDWYRQQLQYYIALCNNAMQTLMTELTLAQVRIQTIEALPKGSDERRKMIEDFISNTCAAA